jgi:hypothetical protein
MKTKDFNIDLCGVSCIGEILRIQAETFADLEDTDILRKNTDEMLLSCLKAPQITLGAWRGGVLAAFSILYFPQDDAENLVVSLDGVDTAGLKSANNKLCIVRKAFQGNSLQYELGLRLEPYALEAGAGILCSTVSPKNPCSIENMLRMGYAYNRTLQKYGLERNLYYKFI